MDISVVLRAIAHSKRILVVAGAGISTSCGIPDFRSKGTGFHDMLRSLPVSEFVNEPQEIFDINIFRSEPYIFYNVAELLYKTFDVIMPSPSHLFIAWLHNRGQLLRCYTQNLDNLERVAGLPSEKLIHCHGNLATASCLECGAHFPIHNFMDDIRAKKVIRCVQTTKRSKGGSKKKRKTGDSSPVGVCNGLIKPDVVFFHETLPAIFDETLPLDLAVADMVIVMGSSMRVAPVSKIPLHVPSNVPTIAINMEPLYHIHPFAQFLGRSDDIATWIMRTLDTEHHSGAPHPFLIRGNMFSFLSTLSPSTAPVVLNSVAAVSVAKKDKADTASDKHPQGQTAHTVVPPVVPPVVAPVPDSATFKGSMDTSPPPMQDTTVLGITESVSLKSNLLRTRSGRLIKRTRSVLHYLERESQYLEYS